MSLIKDKEIRRHLTRAFKIYNNEQRGASEAKLTLKWLDEVIAILGERRKEANKLTSIHIQRELSEAYLYILVLTLASLAVDSESNSKPPISKDWLSKDESPDPNDILQKLLSQIVNYSLAIVRLVEDGLDNPASCVLRALNELCCQFLVLSSERATLKAYAQLRKPEEAKQVWYELFAKKRKLSKSIENLEARIGIPTELISVLRAYREDTSILHSEAVHHSFSSTVLRAYAVDLETEDNLHFALLGRATRASETTLNTLNTILMYTSLMFLNILIKIHGFKPQSDDALWKGVFLLADCARTLYSSKEGGKK